MFDLIDDLETTILIEDYEIPLDLSFDTVLKFYELLEDDRLQSFEKIYKAFDLFYFGDETLSKTFTFEQKSKAVEDISSYIQKNAYGNSESDESFETDGQPEKLYSYSQDAGAIYASFFADYGIDLLTQRGKMHYLTFKALNMVLQATNKPIQKPFCMACGELNKPVTLRCIIRINHSRFSM